MVTATMKASDALRRANPDDLAPFTLLNNNGQMCALGVLYNEAGGNWGIIASDVYGETILSDELSVVSDTIRHEFGLNREEQGVVEDLFDNTVKDYMEAKGIPSNVDVTGKFERLPITEQFSILEMAQQSCIRYLEDVED